MTNKKKFKEVIYFIEWHDAHSASGWHTEKEVENFINKDKCICENIGYILSETKDEIVMASRRLKWAENGEPVWGMLQKIPKTWIRKKILLRRTP